MGNGPELAVDDVPDGIVQPKANQEERRAAGHPGNRHGKAPLVAEHVAAGNLPREREPAPERTDALEKDSLPWLGRKREHELGRSLTQARDHGAPRGNERHAHTHAAGEKRHGGVHGKWTRHCGHGIDHAIGGHDDGRKRLRENGDTQDRPAHAGDGGVDKVARCNAALGVAQCLERADKDTVVLDHASHGGKRNKRGNKEEEHGEDVCDAVHAARVLHVGLHALVLRAVEQVDIGLLQGVHLRLGVINLCLRVVELGLDAGLLLLVAGKAVLVACLCVCQLVLCLRELGRMLVERRTGVRELSLCAHALLVELSLGAIELGLGVRELRLGGGELLHARKRLVYLVELGLRRSKLATQRLKRRRVGGVALRLQSGNLLPKGSNISACLLLLRRKRSRRLVERRGTRLREHGRRVGLELLALLVKRCLVGVNLTLHVLKP